jgi:ABC-type microcin C transport system permease subunit YejB
MWQRIGARFPIWFDPEVLAIYRLHQGAETSRIRKSVGFGREYLRFFGIVSEYHRYGTGDAYWKGRKKYSVVTVQESRDLLVAGLWANSFRELLFAGKLGVSKDLFKELLSFLCLFIRVVWVGLKSCFKPAAKEKSLPAQPR